MHRLGIDVGGTFTDLVLHDVDTNQLEFAKTPSTPANQAKGVGEGIRQLLKRTEVLPEQIAAVIHGTTVATNTLIEREGAHTALIVTDGFRDVLEIARQDRPRLYDFRVRRPKPLVPRYLRFEVRERILHTGEVAIPMEFKGLDSLIRNLAKNEIEAVAVCLLHSYQNSDHEVAIAEKIEEDLPHVLVTLSSQILPEFREYERMSTTVINAYISKSMAHYLDHLRTEFTSLGIRPELLIMQSNGGIMGIDAAIRKPVHTILSGPAGGVVGGIAIGNHAGFPNIISVDMGGTSFDICLSRNGTIRQTEESEIEGLPVKTPMIDIHTLGAGGGSVAWIDSGGSLRVGPMSSGADPGPACYQRGGEAPTVTDANLVLGRINPDGFLGGTMSLDLAAAKMAIEKSIAEPLGLDLEHAAEGIVRVVNSNMIRGIRIMSIARGYDPREFCLLAFGGAGPLHAAELATELGIPFVLVPPAPGVTSAMGLLMADFRRDYVRTFMGELNGTNSKQLRKTLSEMRDVAIHEMRKDLANGEEIQIAYSADLRYRGQGYELKVPLEAGDGRIQIGELATQFHALHRRSYGFDRPDHVIEIINLRLSAKAPTPNPNAGKQRSPEDGNPRPPINHLRDVYIHGEFHETSVYVRGELKPGDELSGPAVIEQMDTTTLVLPGQCATVDEFSNIVLRLE